MNQPLKEMQMGESQLTRLKLGEDQLFRWHSDQLGNSKFRLLYEPLETDFELSSFGITAPKSFSSSDHTLMKDRARFRAVIIWDHRSKSFSSSDHTLTKDPN